MNVPSLSSGATNLEGSATVDDVEIAPDSMGSTVEASTGTQSSTSAEAEIEAEAEAEAGNNAAAVAVVASGGSGAAGIGSAALASASTAGSVSTQDHAGIFHQNNDLTQIDGELTDRDDALSADVIADRSDNADGDQNAPGGAAEAEVEAEATAEADDPAFGNVTSGAGCHDRRRRRQSVDVISSDCRRCGRRCHDKRFARHWCAPKSMASAKGSKLPPRTRPPLERQLSKPKQNPRPKLKLKQRSVSTQPLLVPLHPARSATRQVKTQI